MSEERESETKREPAQQELTEEQLDQVAGGRLASASSPRTTIGTTTTSAGLGGATTTQSFGADYSETSNI